MQLCVVLLALVGLSVAAPQAAWPYPDSLLPYRYGYPGQGQYKYLPELEDDEEVGPYLSSHKTGRQDLVVGEGAPTVKPTDLPAPSVVETGSVAPVKETEPSKVHAESPPPPKVTPVAAAKPEEKPVQPPPFPPARPPPTEAPKEKEEDEEDDDSEEDDAEELHEEELEQNDEHDEQDDSEELDDEHDEQDDSEEQDDDPEEDDDDDDRRRQAPLHDEDSSSVAPVVVPAPAAAVESPSVQPVVVVPSSEPAVVENEVVKSVVKKPAPPAPVVDTDDESSEEVRVPPVEALVPGYITEQGEVLVPVDTVIGDQPISIVDDPSSPPARGVPFHAPPYDGFRSPYYYPNLYRPESSRQDESEELDDDVETEDDAQERKGSSSAGRNGFLNSLTSFPPSRTPELYGLIESRIPVDTNVDFEDYQVYRHKPAPMVPKKPYGQQAHPFYSVPQSQSRPVYNPYGRPPYGIQQAYNRPSVGPVPVAVQVPYNRRPEQGQGQNFMISLALAGNGPYSQQQSPFRVRPNPNQVVPIPVRSNGGYSGYNRYQGPYRYPSPFYVPYQQNPFYRKPVYQPQPQPEYGHYYGGPQYEQYVQSQYGPFRVGGYSPRPQYHAQEEYPGTMSGGFRPQINNRIVIHGSGGQTQARPVPIPVPGYNYNRPAHVGYRRPVSKPGHVVKVQNPHKKENKVKVNKHSNKRRPTPVIKQDDEVYPYEPVVVDDSTSVDSSGDVADSYEHEQELHLETQQRGTTVTKSRRIPKMAKKSKVSKKKVTASNADPLNILKKSNSKSRRN